MIAPISSTDLYNLVRDKIGERQAKALVDFVEQKVATSLESQRQHLASKDDIARVGTKISDTKAEILRWMFAMFVPFYAGLIVFLVNYFT